MRRLTTLAVALALAALTHTLYGAELTPEQLAQVHAAWATVRVPTSVTPQRLETPLSVTVTPDSPYVSPPTILPVAPQAKPAFLTEADLPAGAQPAPWPGVAVMLRMANLRGSVPFYDPGCGPDARLLIEACKYFPQWTGKATGVEIVPEYADAARRAVAAAGFSDRIEIRQGDSTKLTPPPGCVVAGYMWEAFWEAFRPQLGNVSKLVSYGWKAPGLPMQTVPVAGGGVVYVWNKPAAVASVPATIQVPITNTVRQTVQLPRGSYCEVCNGYCRYPMAHKLQQQVVGYRTVTATTATQPAASANPTVMRSTSNCPNGNCPNSNQRRGLFGRWR
jgi:hypothetical protein